MVKETIQTGKPLETAELITLTGKDALYKIGDYKVRIMNYSEGQSVAIDDVVEQDGYLWGIKKLNTPKPQYDSIAFIAVR